MYSYQQVLEQAARQLEITLNSVARMRGSDLTHAVAVNCGTHQAFIEELSPTEEPVALSDTCYVELTIDGAVVVSEALLLSPGYNPDILPTRYEQLSRMLLHSIFTSGVATFYNEATGLSVF